LGFRSAIIDWALELAITDWALDLLIIGWALELAITDSALELAKAPQENSLPSTVTMYDSPGMSASCTWQPAQVSDPQPPCT
jgi:hypothetical protein